MLKDRYREALSQKYKCNFVYSTEIVTIDPAKHTDVKSGTYVFLNCTGALSQAETANTVKLDIPDICECRIEYHEPKEEVFGSKEWQAELKKLRDVVIPTDNIHACWQYESKMQCTIRVPAAVKTKLLELSGRHKLFTSEIKRDKTQDIDFGDLDGHR